MSRRLERHARKAASSRRLPADERRRLAEEFLAHLRDSALSHREAGLSPRKAERRAIRDFGDERKVRIDLGRVWRGRRVSLFPGDGGERLGTVLAYNLRAIIVIVAIVILLRWQVVAAYHIPTKSMEPTLLGDPAHGDKILVNKLYYHLYEPERWQVAVFMRDNYDQNLIKRILGLPGEEIDIRNGDILIDGEIPRKPASVQRALLIPVFHDNRDVVAEQFGETSVGLSAWPEDERNEAEWSEEDGVFRGRAGAGGVASLAYGRQVVDVYEGSPPRHDTENVGDLLLEFRVTPGEGCEMVGLQLEEDGDRYELDIPVGDTGATTLKRSGSEAARLPYLHLPRGEEHHLGFSNIDGRIRLEVDGEELLLWEVPEADAGSDADPAESGFEIDRMQSGAKFGFRGGEAEFRDLALLRDIHYRHMGRLPVKIPEGRYFMLGDNSGNSDDSRSWGTVSRDQLIGRPMVVFWPLSRLQLIR